jgi:hypothetical protein
MASLTSRWAGRVRPDRFLVGIVVAVVWGLITHGTFAGSGDEPHYLVIAHSLAFDGDLDVGNNYREAALIGGGTLQPEAHARLQGRRLLPVHDIGMPLLFAPVVRVAYTAAERLGDLLPTAVLRVTRLNKGLLLRHALSLLMALITGLLAREMFLLLRAVVPDASHAIAWSALFALSPPVLSHSFLFFTEIPSAFITLFVFRRVIVEPLRSTGAAAATGILTGLLFLIHARNVGMVAGLTLAAVLAARQRLMPATFLKVFLTGVVAAVLARTMTTYALWGTLVTTPHADIAAVETVGAVFREMFVRATGLLLDREYGLLAYAPIYLLAGPGLVLLARRGGLLSRGVFLAVGCYLVPVLLPITNLHGWTGGWSPAARFLVPAVPLLWIGVYLVAHRATRPAWGIVMLLVIFQVTIDAYVWQFPRTLWNDGDGVTALLLSAWLPSWSADGTVLIFAIAASAIAGFTWALAGRLRAAGDVWRVQ